MARIQDKDLISAALSLELAGTRLTKGQRTQLRILYAVIETYAKRGLDLSTYDAIATTGKISRTLILYYFPDRSVLFQTVIKLIRHEFQKLAIARIQSKTDPLDMLVAYIRSTFEWLRTKRTHAAVWHLFLQGCIYNKKWRVINTEFVVAGENRIRALLENGTKSGTFRSTDHSLNAKMIQIVITGALLTQGTENHSLPESLESQTVKTCLDLANR